MRRSHLHVIEPVVGLAMNWANTGKLYKLVMLHAKFQQMLNYCLPAFKTHCVIFLKHVILEENNLREIL